MAALSEAVADQRAKKVTSGKGNSYVPLIRGEPKSFEESELPIIKRHPTLKIPITYDHVNPEWLVSTHGQKFNHRTYIADARNNDGPGVIAAEGAVHDADGEDGE